MPWQSQHANSGSGASEEDAAWHSFAGAQSSDNFLNAWLAVLCIRESHVRAATVLWRSTATDTFTPVALWPNAPRDLSFLGKVCERAISTSSGILERGPADNPCYHAAIPLNDAATVCGVVALELSVQTEAAAQEILRDIHWAMGWPRELIGRQRSMQLEQKMQRIGSISEVIATSIQQGPLQQILFDVVNDVTRQLQASRTAIGLVSGHRVIPKAISDAAHFENNTETLGHYAAAMQEAMDLGELIQIDAGDSGDQSRVSMPAHAELIRYSKSQAIVSVPLQLGARKIGALIVERFEPLPFEAADLDWLRALANTVPAVIELKRSAQQSLWRHLRNNTTQFLTRLLGPRHLVYKYVTVCVIAVVAALCLVRLEYRVTATTSIEGEVQRVAAAPFEGFLAASYVRAGDVVSKDQLLCTLDDRDIRLERDKWLGEREQHSRELRQAMAEHDLSKVQIYEAQVRQADAHYRQVEDQLRKAQVKAPFNGVVISGDLSQLVGSPVERGKKLFEIAPLESYRVILQVDESELRHVTNNQRGVLLVSGVADQPIIFHVSHVTPVATAKEGKNYFRVEASLDSAPPKLRPGMEGVGKIDIGQRSLWWILTHSSADWLRLWLWRWLP